MSVEKMMMHVMYKSFFLLYKYDGDEVLAAGRHASLAVYSGVQENAVDM